jgi:hypothetical protein
MVEGKPVVWVKKKPNAYRMVSDQDGTRLEPSKSTVLRVVGTVFFLVLATITALSNVGIYNEVQYADDSSIASGCWEWQSQVIVGGNPPYCTEETIITEVVEIEVSDDQHIRETAKDWESGSTWQKEYRWEDVGESIVYGLIKDGSYYCVRYVPEFALPDDWVVEDIDASFEYPDWCDSAVEGQEGRVYEEGAHPYDDVWMYDAYDVERMSAFLIVYKTTQDRTSELQYIAKSIVEQERADRGAEGDQFSLGTLFCTAPLILLFLFFADQRPRVFVIDRQGNTITRRRSGRYPSFSRTWSDVNFSATAVVRSVREKHHSTAATEDSPAQHWTTHHPGLNIVISYGPFREVLLFFEDGGNVNVHGRVITDFMAAMGLEFQSENSSNISNPQAELYARPTLQYIAESHGVSEWNDVTAQFIVSWYYESDPHFIEKYPQFEENPEFMLEPHGNRPLKEMYWRPFFDGAGLATVRSTEDAQRLLDHLLSLRYPESTHQETPLNREKKAVVDASVASPPPSASKGDETVDVESGRKDDEAVGLFWNFDDAQNP